MYNLLERLFDVVGLQGLQIQARQADAIQLRQLPIGQILGLRQEDLFGSFEQWMIPDFLFSDLVHRFVYDLHYMEPIKEDGRFRQVLLHAFNEGRQATYRRTPVGFAPDWHYIPLGRNRSSGAPDGPLFYQHTASVFFHSNKEAHIIVTPGAAVSSTPFRVTAKKTT